VSLSCAPTTTLRAQAHAVPWVGTASLPRGFHFSDTGEPRGQAELPSGRKTEGTGAQARQQEKQQRRSLARASEPETSQVKRRPLRAIDYREAQRDPARFSAAAARSAMDRPTSRPGSRARAAGRLPSRSTSASGAEVREYDLEHTDTAIARTASAGAGVLRVPLALCGLQTDSSISRCRQSSLAEPGAIQVRRVLGVLRPACAGLRLKRPCQLH